MKINTKLTPSQLKTISEYDDGRSTVTSVSKAGNNRVIFHVRCKGGFFFYLYVGKRGKIFETENYDW